MKNVLTFIDSLNVVGNVCKAAKNILTPVGVKNCGKLKNLNRIEVCNPSPNLVKNVVVRIKGLPADECWWEHPNNSEDQALLIPYIEPRGHTVKSLMFTHFDSSEVQCEISWDDWFGMKHSDKQILHLEGLC